MTVHSLVLTLLVVIDINSKSCNIDLDYKSFTSCFFRKRGNENIKSMILNILKKILSFRTLEYSQLDLHYCLYIGGHLKAL